MKIKLLVDPSMQEEITNKLQNAGFEIDEQAEFVLMQKNVSLRYITGKIRDQLFYIDIKDVIYFESLGHDLLIHCKDEVYKSNERLKNIESSIDTDNFLRISNSIIVSIPHIKRIEASLFQKFILHLDNGDLVDVTRSYYYIFKNKIGI